MTAPRRILLLASVTGYQLRTFAEAAARLGVDVTLATDCCLVLEDPWADNAIPVRFHDPAKYSIALATEGSVSPFDAIVAVGDRPTLLAAMTADRLGLPYNSPASVDAAGNKFIARERFKAAGLPVPDYFRLGISEDPRQAASRAVYPCVLKPLGLSASRGVIRADNPDGFVSAFGRIKALLESREIRMHREERNQYIQVERYIEGREFAVEGLVTDGRVKVLALFDKPDAMEGPFFEETIYVTPSRESDETQRAMVEAVQRGVEALGLTRGPLHAELRWNSEGAWILEMAARPIGGLCAKALTFNEGTTLEELVLRHALGEDVSAARVDGPASGVMMIPIPRPGIYRGVEGVESAEAVPGVTGVAITAAEGQRLVPLPEGASYLGFIFARGRSPQDVERAIRTAHAALRFDIATALPVAPAAP